MLLFLLSWGEAGRQQRDFVVLVFQWHFFYNSWSNLWPLEFGELQGAWHGIPPTGRSVCAAFAKAACLTCKSFAFGGRIGPGNAGDYCGDDARPPKLPFLATPQARKAEQRGCSVLFPQPYTWLWAGDTGCVLTCSTRAATFPSWDPLSSQGDLPHCQPQVAVGKGELAWQYGMRMAGMAAWRAQHSVTTWNACAQTRLSLHPSEPGGIAGRGSETLTVLLHLSVCSTHQILCRHVSPGRAGPSQRLQCLLDAGGMWGTPQVSGKAAWSLFLMLCPMSQLQLPPSWQTRSKDWDTCSDIMCCGQHGHWNRAATSCGKSCSGCILLSEL